MSYKCALYFTGEIICFHNYRVLHGRDGYKSQPDCERHLEGGFLDWDELHSRRRVIQKDYGITPELD